MTGSHTLAIAAHKGGVGKTTTAIALAAGLARAGQGPVLLVDLDPQGHSTIALDVAFLEDRTVRDLLIEEPAPLHTVVYETGVSSLVLVPATIRLERVARSLLGRTHREDILRKALAPATAIYPWILIDCPPSLGILVENALVAATDVLVPCRSEARGADGLVDLLEVLTLVNPYAALSWRILRTMRHGSETVANAVLDAALEPYTAQLLTTVIPRCLDLNHAQAARRDVFDYAPKSTGAQAYAQLVAEVCDVEG